MSLAARLHTATVMQRALAEARAHGRLGHSGTYADLALAAGVPINHVAVAIEELHDRLARLAEPRP